MSVEVVKTQRATALGAACAACGIVAIIVGNWTGAIEPSIIAVIGIALGVLAWRGGRRWLAGLGILICLAPIVFWVVFAVNLFANGELGF